MLIHIYKYKEYNSVKSLKVILTNTLFITAKYQQGN